MTIKVLPAEYITVPNNSTSQPTYQLITASTTVATVKAQMLGFIGLYSRSILRDTGTIDTTSGKQRFNRCSHTHNKITCDAVAVRKVPIVVYHITDGSKLCTAVGGVAPYNKPSMPVPVEITDAMRARAFSSMYPDIGGDLNLMVSLLEFRDISRLLKTVGRMKSFLSSFSNASSELFRKKGSLLSAVFLSYQFGVKPIVNDLRGITEHLLDLKKKVSDFKNRGKVVNNYHYTEVIEELSSESDQDHLRRYRTYFSCKYNATMRLTYEYNAPNFWDTVLRVGGLRLTAATIWEIIPWSFVVDWILNVQKFLEQFDKDPNIRIVVHDYCDSIKSVNGHQQKYADTHVPMPHDVTSYDVDATREEYYFTDEVIRYDRVPGIPNTGYALPMWDSLSDSQLVLGAALAHTYLT